MTYLQKKVTFFQLKVVTCSLALLSEYKQVMSVLNFALKFQEFVRK